MLIDRLVKNEKAIDTNSSTYKSKSYINFLPEYNYIIVNLSLKNCYNCPNLRIW